ncbi:LOW QUALITY PROTEIN: hypothetical protein HID58_013028 [Brassica napus]|uniref:Uncharacterized protein n=1 Tax=Brassica napus TaxID=3708 RepID=A0ABQ8E2R8_BRANA|nr:LOW QUALITY PROTEIN: hypothetical protein HID58_013028 [Brassica napus]
MCSSLSSWVVEDEMPGDGDDSQDERAVSRMEISLERRSLRCEDRAAVKSYGDAEALQYRRSGEKWVSVAGFGGCAAGIELRLTTRGVQTLQMFTRVQPVSLGKPSDCVFLGLLGRFSFWASAFVMPLVLVGFLFVGSGRGLGPFNQ